jgi:hypothetical protein
VDHYIRFGTQWLSALAWQSWRPLIVMRDMTGCLLGYLIGIPSCRARPDPAISAKACPSIAKQLILRTSGNSRFSARTGPPEPSAPEDVVFQSGFRRSFAAQAKRAVDSTT